MILQPLPRLVLPTLAPPFWPLKSCRPQTLGEIESSSFVQISGQALQHRLDDSLLAPVLKAPMHRLIRSVALRQILPRRTGAQNPQDPIESPAPITPRSPSPILSPCILRDEFLDHLPLHFC